MIVRRNYSVQSAVSSPGLLESHLTILYLGPQEEERMKSLPISEMYQDLINEFSWPLPIRLEEEVSLFGQKGTIPVKKAEPKQFKLHFVRCVVEDFFRKKNIKIPSDYPIFNPHITLENKDQHADQNVLLYFPHLTSWELDA